jgi:hypothetical protein
VTAPQRYQQWQGLLKVKPFGLLRKKFLFKNFLRANLAQTLPLLMGCR